MGDKKTDLIAKAICVVEEATASFKKKKKKKKRLRQDEWMKRVRILAVRDGCVYMEFWSIRKPNSYLLVLNWETMKLRVIANNTTDKYRGPAFPFFMTWAPPLLSPAEQQRLRLQGDLFQIHCSTCYVSKQSYLYFCA